MKASELIWLIWIVFGVPQIIVELIQTRQLAQLLSLVVFPQGLEVFVSVFAAFGITPIHVVGVEDLVAAARTVLILRRPRRWRVAQLVLGIQILHFFPDEQAKK